MFCKDTKLALDLRKGVISSLFPSVNSIAFPPILLSYIVHSIIGSNQLVLKLCIFSTFFFLNSHITGSNSKVGGFSCCNGVWGSGWVRWVGRIELADGVFAHSPWLWRPSFRGSSFFFLYWSENLLVTLLSENHRHSPLLVLASKGSQCSSFPQLLLFPTPFGIRFVSFF